MFKEWIEGRRQRSENSTDSPRRSFRVATKIYMSLMEPSPPRRSIFPQPRSPRFLGYHSRPKFLQSDPGSGVDIPNGGNRHVVIYFASILFEQKILEECRTVKSILHGFQIPIDGRDLSIDYEFRVELKTILGTVDFDLPTVFIGGKYIGGVEEIKQLQKSGELKKMIDALPIDTKFVKMRGVFKDFISNEDDQIVDDTENARYCKQADQNVDDAEKARYRKQAEDSCGFNFDDDIIHPILGIYPYDCFPDLDHLGYIGLHCYNIEKGTNLQLKRLLKGYAADTDETDYYITLEAMDPIDNSVHIFETRVWNAEGHNQGDTILRTIICRIKPQVAGLGDARLLWDFDAIDDFYKGDLPGWLPDDALTGSDKLQYYELTESDIEENIEWLLLYAENVLYSVGPCCYARSYGRPIVMKKIVVQTKEEVVSNMKLKSRNAIFYIELNTFGFKDAKGVVRKTMDGRIGHISLQSQLVYQDTFVYES